MQGIILPLLATLVVLSIHVRASKKEEGGLNLDIRLPLAGGLAGGTTNALLFPIDTFKTLRQTDKSINTFGAALSRLRAKGLKGIYSGFVPAVYGAIPSSALYFGGYEWSKVVYTKYLSGILPRTTITMMSAATGNAVSSVVFVPKDVIKQNMQSVKTAAIATGKSTGLRDVVASIYKKQGLQGFYRGYRATVFRNVPGAVIRFALYEELKVIVKRKLEENGLDDRAGVAYFISGSLASSFASACTTPFDVLKSRLATGVIKPGTGPLIGLRQIAASEGVAGLYAGVGARVLWSALFGGIGLFCFEKYKFLLGATDANGELKSLSTQKQSSNGWGKHRPCKNCKDNCKDCPKTSLIRPPLQATTRPTALRLGS
jgi:solute carrier family 25 S-adenosylmethionine transporter 26